MRFPFIPNVTPEFTRQFDFRFAIGQLPFTNNPSGIMGGWIRFKELPSQPCSVSHLLGLVDAWPPSVLQMCNGFAPASSLTWTLELLRDPADGATSDWWQYFAEAEQAGDGYAQIAAKCWNQRGELVAITRQTVTVFA
jgi:acyl-CoA thioesterase